MARGFGRNKSGEGRRKYVFVGKTALLKLRIEFPGFGYDLSVPLRPVLKSLFSE